MNFSKAENRNEMGMCLEMGDIEMGIYPVIYGYRVRVGYVGDGWCQLDLCGGDNVDMIDLLYNGCRQIMEGQMRVNKRVDFSEFPVQMRKPFFKDMDFLKKFCDLILKYREHDIDLPEHKVTAIKLAEIRKNQIV